jgi:hypothetical protein
MIKGAAVEGSPVVVDVVPFGGWPNALRLRNGAVELIVTLDVGPRILSFAKPGGANPFKLYADQAGGTGEAAWRNRGGHRMWIAPEIREITYFPDNAPVGWEHLQGKPGVRLTPPPEAAIGFQKQIDIELDPTGAGATIVHRLTRLAATPADVALWALTVMTPGGVAVMPQPPMGQHPRDLLPNRKLVVWPYTDLSDPRWRFGRHFFRLRQDGTLGPTKLGLADPLGWCAYFVDGVCFIKRYDLQPEGVYPDGGCNFETFTNEKMLEIESLGPLISLKGGQSIEHRERWELHDAPKFNCEHSDEKLVEFFGSILSSETAPPP